MGGPARRRRTHRRVLPRRPGDRLVKGPVGVFLIAAALAGAPPAAARQSISASPNPVRFGETLVVKGKGWPVIEFCSRTLRLSLRSDQNSFRIGAVRVGA